MVLGAKDSLEEAYVLSNPKYNTLIKINRAFNYINEYGESFPKFIFQFFFWYPVAIDLNYYSKQPKEKYTEVIDKISYLVLNNRVFINKPNRSVHDRLISHQVKIWFKSKSDAVEFKLGIVI